MSSRYFILSLCCAAALAFLLAEPAFANRLANIGGGVSGDTREKLRLLRYASLGLGGILALIGLLSLIPIFQGASELKVPKLSLRTSAVLVIIGAMFIGLYLL